MKLIYLTGTIHIVPPLTDLDPVYRPLRPLFIDMIVTRLILIFEEIKRIYNF